MSVLGPDEDRGATANAEHFVETPIEEWFLTCGHFCVAKVRNASGELYSEARHQDGGASVLHLGLTLWGRRDCVFEEVAGNSLRRDGSPRKSLCNVKSGRLELAGAAVQ